MIYDHQLNHVLILMWVEILLLFMSTAKNFFTNHSGAKFINVYLKSNRILFILKSAHALLVIWKTFLVTSVRAQNRISIAENCGYDAI